MHIFVKINEIDSNSDVIKQHFVDNQHIAVEVNMRLVFSRDNDTSAKAMRLMKDILYTFDGTNLPTDCMCIRNGYEIGSPSAFKMALVNPETDEIIFVIAK